MSHKKRCIGYDEEGRYFDCPNPPMHRAPQIWCQDCETRRRARIGAQLNKLLDEATARLTTGDEP